MSHPSRFHAASWLTATAFATLAATSQAAEPAKTWCADRCDQIVIDWNQQTHQVIKAATGYQDPVAASRILAMVHLAMHDAVNATQPRYRAYAYQPRTPAGKTPADAAVAAAVAAHDVLAALFPKQKEMLRATLDASLHDAGIGAAVGEGKRLGAEAAAAMLVRRADDGSQADEAYRPGTRPGEYRFVPGFDFVAAPHWRAVKPFTMRSPQQFRVAAPPALASAAYATDFNEVKATGSKAANARRSTDQTQYAAYWYEFSDSGWNRIARAVARDKPQDLWQRARTFALLNAVMADAYIAGWDSKMHYNLWRPVTAIQQADADGNPATTAAAHWVPMLTTPPVQDHPSTHSALGAAAAVALAHAFGGDRVTFTMASPSALPDAPARTFASFSEAAKENADSRVRAGLHFRFATTAGLQLGEQIGQQAARDMLGPVGAAR
ncbi:vanadium-dependent haloperoxidase [Hydrogenophaga sp.]|uniref:vanadium-dependent haloperoxidase n=1 Tax=Hydrogenophaga sp. TaxID=1904254 RepID=UPI0025C2648E|nr:vanadium-dependent haloperoxidase [Hydrogenophaga sp.]MBT9462935.1 phosphatase PAP2 family protein [Hydrogenophaga sp.]